VWSLDGAPFAHPVFVMAVCLEYILSLQAKSKNRSFSVFMNSLTQANFGSRTGFTRLQQPSDEFVQEPKTEIT